MSRRALVILAVLAALVLAVVVPPYITLNRLKGRLAGALSGALGRPVTMGEVTLRLVPGPGFELTNFSIADDPAFSAEPILRADTVTARLRLSSLWRGRLEIATLSLDNPSLNLVRNGAGQWNLQPVLLRATSTPAAPTGKRRPEVRPRFPYIEASAGRINFKIENEKKVWAISDADFALWLQSENEWRMRLEGRPVRTDLNLSDTGTMKLEGRFQRRPVAAETPVEFSGELADTQLRELVRLLTGADHGWAGKLTTDFRVAGTVSRLEVTADARLEDFRRYDIMSGEIMRFRARCAAVYDTGTEVLDKIDCAVPLGDGKFAARGQVAQLFGQRGYDLTLASEQVPANALVALARHAKKDMAGDLNADGQLDGTFSLHGSGSSLALSGQGQASAVILRSAELSSPLRLGNFQFGFLPPPQPPRRGRAPLPSPNGAQQSFVVEAGSVPMGAPRPLDLRVQASREGYEVFIQGGASLPRVIEAAHVAGFRPPEVRATGSLGLDLHAQSGWTGFRPPQFTGTLNLANLSAEVSGLAAPLSVDSASVSLSADTVRASGVLARLDGAHLAGAVWLPRGCAHAGDCTVGFSVRADRLDLDAFNRLLNPRLQSRPWYQVVTGGARVESAAARLRAEGDFAIERLVAKRLEIGKLAGHLAYADGRLVATSVHGSLPQGGQIGAGSLRADFTADPPRYEVEGRFDRVNVQPLAVLTRGNWGTGAVSGRFGLTFGGWNAAEMLNSAQGGGEFDWRGGALRLVPVAGRGPLPVQRFSGILRLKDRSITLSGGTLVAPHATYSVSGSAGFDRRLQFTLDAPSGGFAIAGTFDAPRVTVIKAAPQTASKQE